MTTELGKLNDEIEVIEQQIDDGYLEIEEKNKYIKHYRDYNDSMNSRKLFQRKSQNNWTGRLSKNETTDISYIDQNQATEIDQNVKETDEIFEAHYSRSSILRRDDGDSFISSTVSDKRSKFCF